MASDFPDLARWVAWCYGFFFHDGGVLAGDIRAAVAALPHVQSRAAQLGLRLNLAKCEVVAVGRTSAGELAAHLPDALLRHPDGSSKVRRNFDLLVAPVGNDAFIAAHAAERVKRARPLLEAVGKLDDRQVGLRLLRACAGHSRLHGPQHACAPPVPQRAALKDFDLQVRGCLAGLSGLRLDAVQWGQAGRSFAQAGLGLRSTAQDSPAAFLASVGGSAWCGAWAEA